MCTALERLNAILALEDKVPTVDGMGISSNLSKVIIKLEMTLGGIADLSLYLYEHLNFLAYDFVRQCLRPITMCLNNHFNGDKVKFLNHWIRAGDQRFTFTNFYSACSGIENNHKSALKSKENE
jgi:hypothetical protein